MPRKVFNSFRFAFRGLQTVWREENNFRIEILIALIFSFVMFYFHFSVVELALGFLAIIVVLTSEIINTAIEDLCNKIEPHHDSKIGKIKDTVGAFVLVAVVGAVIVGVLIFYHHFFIVQF